MTTNSSQHASSSSGGSAAILNSNNITTTNNTSQNKMNLHNTTSRASINSYGSQTQSRLNFLPVTSIRSTTLSTRRNPSSINHISKPQSQLLPSSSSSQQSKQSPQPHRSPSPLGGASACEGDGNEDDDECVPPSQNVLPTVDEIVHHDVRRQGQRRGSRHHSNSNDSSQTEISIDTIRASGGGRIGSKKLKRNTDGLPPTPHSLNASSLQSPRKNYMRDRAPSITSPATIVVAESPPINSRTSDLSTSRSSLGGLINHTNNSRDGAKRVRLENGVNISAAAYNNSAKAAVVTTVTNSIGITTANSTAKKGGKLGTKARQKLEYGIQSSRVKMEESKNDDNKLLTQQQQGNASPQKITAVVGAAAPSATAKTPEQVDNKNAATPKAGGMKQKDIMSFFPSSKKRAPAADAMTPKTVTSSPLSRPRTIAQSLTPVQMYSSPFPDPTSITSSAITTDVEELQNQVSHYQNKYKDTLSNRSMKENVLAQQLKTYREKYTQLLSKHETFQNDAQISLEGIIREQNRMEQRDLRSKLAMDSIRLGRIVQTRAVGMIGLGAGGFMESWEDDGYASKEMKQKKATLKKRREELERRMDGFSITAGKKRPRPGGSDEESVKQSHKHASHNNGKHRIKPEVKANKNKMDALDVIQEELSVQRHLSNLKLRENDLSKEEVALHEGKQRHIRALKRLASEDSSRFKDRPKLNDRYIPLSLLGKGGFSEVWRAYDLQLLQEVAVKIHQVDSRWSESKKENYTKHVSREYEIHSNVRHARIVSLFEVFEIDENSFATVLECCNGTDLDTLLKEKKNLREGEAKAILLQILVGMRYLATASEDGRRQGIIHYDLKPGNILFDEFGDAKITDFGLSKIVDSAIQQGGGVGENGRDNGDVNGEVCCAEASMSLTSQGAGTYWYLPPECFMTQSNIRISNKVDVWSIGVIYYQMLYGRRPFGDGQSQDKVLSNQTMLNAHEVIFPSNSVNGSSSGGRKIIQVSEEGKEFIRTCLIYDQADRPSVCDLCQHKYLYRKDV